jgi:mono/diheme cytochrome c family protein
MVSLLQRIVQAIKETNEVRQGWRVFQANCARCHGLD